EAQLPDPLHAAESKGLLGLAATAAVMLFYLIFAPGNELLAFIEVVFAGLFLFVYSFAFRRVRRDGFSSGEVHRALWREPAWWLWWYPRPLRRRGNVWARLPGSVRALRWSVFAFVAFVAAGYLDIAISSALFNTEHGEPRLFISGRLDALSTQVGLAMLGAIVGSWLFFTFRSRKMLTQAGLAPADVNRVMLTVPPSRASFWARPHIATILAPAEAGTAPRLDSPHDYLQSIRRDSDALSGPLRALGAEAAVASRQLVDSIEDSERQIAELARSLEPGEEDRLTDRIEALAGVEEYASMRLLLEKQLQLVREMSARIDAARESRNRRVEMLKTLSLHVASLRARLAQSPSEVHQLTDKVRALCDEIGLRAQSPGDRVNAAVELPTVERTRPAGT
ncbi:MAG TPA: hypothetical protein VMS98_07235, partial [Thermoanaerobaculia bacterium]|nr:hypothetical protein [Thermoanaerobaculia bacterium]